MTNLVSMVGDKRRDVFSRYKLPECDRIIVVRSFLGSIMYWPPMSTIYLINLVLIVVLFMLNMLKRSVYYPMVCFHCMFYNYVIVCSWLMTLYIIGYRGFHLSPWWVHWAGVWYVFRVQDNNKVCNFQFYLITMI